MAVLTSYTRRYTWGLVVLGVFYLLYLSVLHPCTGRRCGSIKSWFAEKETKGNEGRRKS